MSESDLESSAPLHHELKPVRDLIHQWEQLETEVTPLHEQNLQQRQLQQQLQLAKHRLDELESLLLSSGTDGDVHLDLIRVRQLKSQVESEKELLLQVNVSVHDWITQHLADSPVTANSSLKEDVASLYHIWEQLLEKVDAKEATLEEAEKTWLDFQKQLNDLQAEIAADQRKVNHFMESQEAGSCSQSVVQDVVDPSQSSNWMENWSSRGQQPSNMQCDSGISSGSDGEFISTSEREKRLHSLRQLARQLESALAPNNAALLRMNRSLDQTQQELQVLQAQLSHLPPIPLKRSSTSPPPVKEMSVQTDSPKGPLHQGPSLPTPTPSTRTTATRSVLPYWWRILRAALPFHLAILALIYAACTMEPSCCNYLNTFGNSFVPKLSYQGGPPPI